jgi:outer membrane protein OmpA-like peptidoglycan-associated protein
MTRTYSRLVATLCPIALTLAAGCHADAPPPPPVTPVAYVAPPVVVAEPAPAPPTVIHVAPDILATCGIKVEPSGKSPLFEFDSSKLSSDDKHLLGDVATCFRTGALTGRSLRLTGRADSRGTEAYNVSLGDRRATHVQRYLEKQGMAIDHITETSRGALDATGSDENGWMLDRRVDVDLIKGPGPVATTQ